MLRSGTVHRNLFTPSEWAGAVGDLGTMLPLAFALVIFNGYSPHRLFFFWGMAYMITGWYYRIPVAIQPLKAMTVIAIAAGYDVGELASAAVFFGILMILLSATGIIRMLERWFTPALVRGIQLGLGLILFQKAVNLLINSGPYFGAENPAITLNLLSTLVIVILLGLFQFRQGMPVSLLIIMVTVGISVLYGFDTSPVWSESSIAQFALPDPGFLGPAIIFLIIPQLPLTLGNAVYAACDACHAFWPERSERAHPTRFGLSIGVSNVLIGLGSGFPVCHGAGGIVAHAKFGAKTGGTTIVIGGMLIISAIVRPLAGLLFHIPIPVLGALLIITSWGLIALIKDLKTRSAIAVAVIVGLLSFITQNLTVALISGIVIEHILIFLQKRSKEIKGEQA